MKRREETGSITPFVVIVSLAIVLLAALVVDGGRQLNARGRAVAYAQEAARAGAQAINVADPRLDLVPEDALKAAQQYCRQAMAADPQLVKCTAQIAKIDDPGGAFNAVTVSTQIRIKAILLGMVRKSVLNATGKALARPVSGISEPDSGKIPTVGPPSVAPPATNNPTATAPPTPPEVEVTPCTPKPTGTPKPEDPKPGDGDKPEECKKPEGSS